ncbi:MAG TPA: hypothetical protein DCM54_15735 [Gammaproteobacteria bacterium]|nr:hypothetical protein [Gammaproteobacteria bacterium]
MAGPTQPQVTDEVWNDKRVKSFLAMEPHGDESADYHVLLKAYRGMRAEDFGRFLAFFVESGRDLDAKDSSGRTIWQIIGTHRHGAAFMEARNNLETT